MLPFPADGLELRTWRERGYWTLTVRVRRGGSEWSSAERYDRLTRAELQDVLDELPSAVARLAR